MNERSNILDGLNIQTSLDMIRLGTFPNEVCLTPAENEIFTNLVGAARALFGMKSLPPYIQSNPFRVFFDKDEVVFIRRGQQGNGLRIPARDMDKIVRAVHIGVKMYQDAQIHRGETSPVKGAVANEVHDPGFEGLD